MIFEPKGIRLIAASLKNCFPKGIPTIVMHQTHPQIKAVRAISQPKKIIQRMLKRVLPKPAFPQSISFLNGKAQTRAILKHWTPAGTPTMVIQSKSPANAHSNQSSAPPKRNHKIFPNVFIISISLSFFRGFSAGFYFFRANPFFSSLL